MDGPSSDAENETIIATTTYITLSGSHTTESDVFGSAKEAGHENGNKLNKLSSVSKQTEESISPEIHDALTEIKMVERVVEDNILVGNTVRKAATYPTNCSEEVFLNTYQPFDENARNSACCKVHTIIIDACTVESVASSSPTQPAPVNAIRIPNQSPNRLRAVLRRIGMRLLICLQTNKDCIFCLMFFMAFVACASFLTVFFYKTMTLNPQMFQYPVPTGRIYYL